MIREGEETVAAVVAEVIAIVGSAPRRAVAWAWRI